MGFPSDLSDVVLFKIHPAIGIARVSLHDEYYVFGIAPAQYKSGGLMRRQAVQFRVFAYGAGDTGLGELTPAVMRSLGITAVWSARVANRKIARQEGTPLGGAEFVIAAEASSDGPTGGVLTGTLPGFAEGAAIPLGQITSTGLFIPPRGGVHRKTAGEPVPDYPGSATVADTTGDGIVSVRLVRDGNELSVLPATIVIAPQDFSPDEDPPDTEKLLEFLRNTLGIPAPANAPNPHNQTALELDAAALRSGTADFAPGFEVCFLDGSSEVPDVRAVFHQPGVDPQIGPHDIRVRYRSDPAGPGAVPGQLTSGLCSPWQADFTACVGYWNEHLPPRAYLDEGSADFVPFFRKEYANHDATREECLRTGDDFTDHVDRVGVARMVGNRLVETEREPGDDIKT